MGTQETARSARVERWLASGGTVLAASERSARSLTAAFAAARRAEGRSAWRTPAIFSGDAWLRELWRTRNQAGLVLLNPLQEQAVWVWAIGQSPAGESLQHPSRLASAAQRAYRLLCDYAPRSLRATARTSWLDDTAIFSQWLDVFEARCGREGLVSQSRLALEFTAMLQAESGPFLQEQPERSPLLLIGFDRLTAPQRSLFEAWGPWQLDEPGTPARAAEFWAAPDAATEVEACVHWLRSRLEVNPEARLIVVATALAERRGALERSLRQAAPPGLPRLDFEFSLGVPLMQMGLVRSAVLLLRWLSQALPEPDLDWLLGCGHLSASAAEELALARQMLLLRQRGQERPEWRLEDFALSEPLDLSAVSASGAARAGDGCMARLLSAQDRLAAMPARQTPLHWAEAAENLLEAAGWPGFRPLSSVAFQARKRWQRLLEECGSLGFDGSAIPWAEFLSTLAEAASNTIFAAESSDAPIQILEPLESAGQLADGVWFLGADEERWPGRGQPHPLLPLGLQRDTGMPHASAPSDWSLAREATLRLLVSADDVVFSYARHVAGSESRPSRLVSQLLGAPAPLPLSLPAPMSVAADRTERFQDASAIPFPLPEIPGGAATLTRQSQCPFQAFATARLRAEDWDPAEAGLNPKQRGLLLHAVLHRIWGGPQRGGIETLAELQAKPNLEEFVSAVVRAAMADSFDPTHPKSLPRRFPSRYLELEADRLTRLVSDWLRYELTRLPFTVVETEAKRSVTVAGLTLRLRLDRVDRLENGRLLIVDYKSSKAAPNAWVGERPEDIQLPLYATHAFADPLEGLVFARVRPDQKQFYGRVRDAAASLIPDLTGRNGLVRDPLTDAQLQEWRDRIERLGANFVAGRAEVDPREPGKTCERCHLQAVCRIAENDPLPALLDDEGGEDEFSAGDGDA